ncbi:MAG: hypothetical protein AAF607_01680 [Pseudomonadota bacterium]
MTVRTWNSLEVTKLIVGMLTPIILLVVGINFERGQAALDKELQNLEARRLAIRELSESIYLRGVRSELLLSSLKRHWKSPSEVSLDEVVLRKQQYDQAYAEWGRKHQANLLSIRQILGTQEYSVFESVVEFRLVSQAFRPLDECLTTAYDMTIRAQNPSDILTNCNANQLRRSVLDCGYAITDELFRLSANKDQFDQSASIVDQRCPG